MVIGRERFEKKWVVFPCRWLYICTVWHFALDFFLFIFYVDFVAARCELDLCCQ